MNRSVALLLWMVLCAVLLSGVALADSSQCGDNFTVEGSFFSGKTYKTWAEFPGVKADYAFKKVYVYTVKDGWNISQADKEIGVISASQVVSHGKGKTAPLNIVVEEKGAGSKVSMTYSTSGGVSSPDDAVKNHFCATLAEVDKKKHK